MRILILISLILCIGYSETLALENKIRRFEEYTRWPNNYTDEEKASVQKDLSENTSPRGDSVFNAYYRFVYINDSLNNAACHLVEPCRESPFYEQDDSGIFRLKGNCSVDTICVSDTLHLWLRFILFESQTINYSGFGPNAVVRNGNSFFSLNFTQLIAANCWYRLNKRLLSEYAFFLFSGSDSGDNWFNAAKDRADINFDVFDTELPEDLIDDIYLTDNEIYEGILLHSNNIRKLFNIYGLPNDDADTYWRFVFSFFTRGHIFY